VKSKLNYFSYLRRCINQKFREWLKLLKLTLMSFAFLYFTQLRKYVNSMLKNWFWC